MCECEHVEQQFIKTICDFLFHKCMQQRLGDVSLFIHRFGTRTHTLSDVQPRRSRNVVASFGHPAATASAGGHVSLHRSVARQRGEVENSLAHVPEAEREPSRNK